MKKDPARSSRASHKALILQHLQSGKSITPLEALQLFNCLSLHQRVAELRQEGYRIRTTMITVPSGKRVASYSLLEPSPQANNEPHPATLQA